MFVCLRSCSVSPNRSSAATSIAEGGRFSPSVCFSTESTFRPQPVGAPLVASLLPPGPHVPDLMKPADNENLKALMRREEQMVLILSEYQVDLARASFSGHGQPGSAGGERVAKP